MRSRRRSDSRVVILGAGVLGVSSAVYAARRGARVTIVTEAEVGSGASGRSLSWLNASAIRAPEYHRLRVAGIDRYRTLASDDRTRSWLRFDGGVMWGTPEETERYEQILAFESEQGYEAIWAGPEELPDLAPGIDVRAVPPDGAVVNPGDGWVDLPLLLGHLLAEFFRLGGKVVQNAGPALPVVEHGRATREIRRPARTSGTSGSARSSSPTRGGPAECVRPCGRRSTHDRWGQPSARRGRVVPCGAAGDPTAAS